MNPIVLWLFGLMTFLSPVERAVTVPTWPGWQETVEERSQRYEAIAEALYEVAFDPIEPSLFGGGRGRSRTAVFLLAVAYHESGFVKDVDEGPCYRGKDGKNGRCDGGLAACMMQLRVGAGTTIEGWTKEELFADRTKCFRSGLRAMRKSFRACEHLEEDYKLNVYASGTCTRGHHRSKEIVSIARRMLDRQKPPGPDASFLLSELMLKRASFLADTR